MMIFVQQIRFMCDYAISNHSSILAVEPQRDEETMNSVVETGMNPLRDERHSDVDHRYYNVRIQLNFV